jgi:hypothetical protein
MPIMTDYKDVHNIRSRVEADYNTSTVALWDLEGDEKGTRCLGI